MKKEIQYLWECKCGRREFAHYPPEECKKCWSINRFSQVHDKEEDEE